MLGFQLSKIMDQKCTLIEYFTDPKVAIENIDMLITESIDIIFIIVDYQMPKMTGAELIRQIKEKHSNVSCVMLSGQANTTSVNSLKEDNLLDEFIAKPWDEEELFDLLRPLIDSRK
jgi:response regulator RpfG family c-di-GMP phosphodiesterase